MKTCPRCRESKPLTEFNRNRSTADGFGHQCKACMRGYKPSEKASEAYRLYHKRYNFERRTLKYGLSLDRYFEMLAQQGDKCAICGGTDTGSARHPLMLVDHDHACCAGPRSCGKCIRGLICHPCNVALGAAQDDPDRLLAMAAYLLRRIDVLQGITGSGM